MTDDLGLRHELQRSVLDELQDIGHAVRSVQLNIALLLAYERLVAHRAEGLPRLHKILHDADVRTRLDVKVAGIEEPADVQSGNQLERFVLRVGCRTLPVKVEVVRVGRRLPVTFPERLAVPDAIPLPHEHVVHMDGNPYVARGIGDGVIYIIIDDEVVGLMIAVLDVVDARRVDRREVEPHVVILKVVAPGIDVASEYFGRRSVFVHSMDRCRLERYIVPVEFDDRNLRLLRNIANLRQANVRLSDPVVDGMRLDRPCKHLTGPSGRQNAAYHVPAVLREDAAVEQHELTIVRGDPYHTFRILRCQRQVATGFER